ncbi:hypothetical protein ACFVUF_16805 [Lysinibacillus sp. NPDC058154]|uniref:hypothetical protein n=1 Tax=Lysinibacillus sp. NPDC058154 TaxID=3346358 RepID=UPI0036DEB4C5
MQPNTNLNKNNWSDEQKDSFIEEVPPEDIVLWRYWVTVTSVDITVKDWITTHKLSFLISLANQGMTSVLDIYRQIRRRARA